MTALTPKAISVTEAGEPDGFEPPVAYRCEVDPAGLTRLGVSVPTDRLAETHKALAGALSSPVSVLYVQMVDRRVGQQLEKPRRMGGVEKAKGVVLTALQRCGTLLYHDARHQLWLRGRMREQLVLDELGMIWVYPDDPSFRDVLAALEIPESPAQNMDGRDYVKVDFKVEADAEEALLVASLGLSQA